ncbi:MAG: hypothetical protein NWE88_11310 [Candidatus Bathyarchaeota archaeon]|nr:hypothetical protein [Candidatus Bathyarchaeota archaeon]
MRKIDYVGLVVASAFIVNCGYVATNLYGLSGMVSMVFIPGSIVVVLAWFIRNMKTTIVTSFAVIFLTAIFTQFSLSAPVWFGIIDNVLYKNLFIYTVFLKVIQYVFVSTFFSLLAALMAGLAFE